MTIPHQKINGQKVSDPMPQRRKKENDDDDDDDSSRSNIFFESTFT